MLRAQATCCQANRSGRQHKRFAIGQIVYAGGESDLLSSKRFVPTEQAFCCRATCSCRQRKRSAVEHDVHTDGQSELPSSKPLSPAA
jgi:hypothetical protein